MLQLNKSKLLAYMRNKIGEDRDITIVISGEKGNGKSSLAYHLAKEFDPNFSIERNFIFHANYDTIYAKIFQLENSAIVIDEAIDIFYKLDWMNEIQNALIKLFTKTRHRHNIIILCIPLFTELRKSFRNYLVDFWIHIPIRSLNLFFTKTPNTFGSDPWELDRKNKLFRSCISSAPALLIKEDVNTLMKAFEKTDAVGFFTSEPIPEPDLTKFRELSEKAKETYAPPSKNKSNKFDVLTRERLKIALALLHQRGMKEREISEILHMTVPQISNFITSADFDFYEKVRGK